MIGKQLRAIVGERHVLEQPVQLLAYESDGLPGYHKRPRLAVFPGSRNEVIAVLRTLAEHKIPFVPRGAGTGLSGGALADDVVLVGLHRLKRIISVDPTARTATVEPGVVNAVLNRILAPHRLFYAPDPSSETACTIGGNVAENAGGPHCLKYGVTLNHVVAATVVLPNGDVVSLGDVADNMCGYDLLGAFIGSEGCFGVVVDVTVRLTQRPDSVQTLLADFLSVDAAARATSAIIASGIVPAALEFMDHATINVVEASIYAAGYPTDAAAVLLIEVDGTAASTMSEMAVCQQLCLDAGARTVRCASNEIERALLWQGRKKAFGAMGRMAPHLVVQDAVIPRTQLPEILNRIQIIGAQHGVTVCNVFHAGDGNLHPNIAYDADDADQARRVHEAMSAIMHACLDVGGSITGEHGVGLDKIGYMDSAFTPDTLSAMCDLRSVFDPERRANPGKVVPIHSCKEWYTAPQTRPTHHAVEHNTHHDTRSDPHLKAHPTRTTFLGLIDVNDQQIVDEIHTAIADKEPLHIVGRGTWDEYCNQSTSPLRTLSLAQDTGIIAYNPGDLTLTVRAGTSLAEIDEALAQHQQWLPLDPQGERTGTIGATVATCSYGPAAEFFGTPRDLVLGLTVVTGEGAILHTGGRVVKNVAGFDLTRLMIGAWGTLGVITQITVRVLAQTTHAFMHASTHPDSYTYEQARAHMRRHLQHDYGYRKPVFTHSHLSSGLKHRFDPHKILNPDLFPEVLE